MNAHQAEPERRNRYAPGHDLRVILFRDDVPYCNRPAMCRTAHLVKKRTPLSLPPDMYKRTMLRMQ